MAADAPVHDIPAATGSARIRHKVCRWWKATQSHSIDVPGFCVRPVSYCTLSSDALLSVREMEPLVAVE